MADPSPADADPEGKTPEGGEGQVPSKGATPDAPEASGRTYDEAYVKQLRKEAASSRTRLAEVEERLQEYEDRDKTEQERLTTRAEAAEKRAEAAEARMLRYEVAADRNLDLKAAAFLTGSTREEIELRAEELSGLLADQGRPATAAGFDGGARQPVPEQKSAEQAHNELLLRSMGRRVT